MTDKEGPRLIDRETVEREYGITKRWLELAAHKKKGPPYRKIGTRMVRYDRQELEAWIAAQSTKADKPADKKDKHDKSDVLEVLTQLADAADAETAGRAFIQSCTLRDAADEIQSLRDKLSIIEQLLRDMNDMTSEGLQELFSE